MYVFIIQMYITQKISFPVKVARPEQRVKYWFSKFITHQKCSFPCEDGENRENK